MKSRDMKKSLVVGVLAAVSTFASASASAFCVNFDSLNDKIQMGVVSGGNAYGDWDYTSGVTIAPCQGNVLPSGSGPAINCAGYRPDLGINIKSTVKLTTRTAEVWIYNGADPAYLVNTDTVTLTPGNCVWTLSDTKSYITE